MQKSSFSLRLLHLSPFTLFLRTTFRRTYQSMLFVFVFFSFLFPCVWERLLCLPRPRDGELRWVLGSSQSRFGAGMCRRPRPWCPSRKAWPQAPGPLSRPSTWSQCVKRQRAFSSRAMQSAPLVVHTLVLSVVEQRWKNWHVDYALLTSCLEMVVC